QRGSCPPIPGHRQSSSPRRTAMHRTLRTATGLIVAAGVPTLTAARAQTPTPNVIATQAGSIIIEQLAQLEHPWGMTYLPDGRLLVTEKPGRLRIFANGTLSDPIAGVPEVAFRGQGGLADVVID